MTSFEGIKYPIKYGSESFNVTCVFVTLFARNRKALESQSLSNDERVTFLETQLKEAKYIAEDADKKYDEVLDPVPGVEGQIWGEGDMRILINLDTCLKIDATDHCQYIMLMSKYNGHEQGATINNIILSSLL